MKSYQALCVFLIGMATGILAKVAVNYLMVEPARQVVAAASGNEYPFTVGRIIDGDTWEGTIELQFGISFTDTWRASDYDAWESRRRPGVTDDEIAKGKAATAAVQELLGSGMIFVSPSADPHEDNFGRSLGTFQVVADNQSIDIGWWMKKEGHVKEKR